MIDLNQQRPIPTLFGEGISLFDLAGLLRAIRDKNLVLQVKIVDRPWEDLSPTIITQMTAAITSGLIRESNDIRLRLFTR